MLEPAPQPICRTTLIPAPAHQACRARPLTNAFGVALRRRAHAGSGRILCPRVTLFTVYLSWTPAQELLLATTEPLFGRPTVVTAGSFNRVGPRIRCTGFRSLT